MMYMNSLDILSIWNETELWIILVVGIIVGMLMGLLAASPIILYAQNKANERKNIQEEILKAKTSLLGQGHWFPVRYCSETRFRKWLKIFPWESTGILFVGDTQVIFFCSFLSWRNLELKFNIEDSKVKWIGRKVWPNGVLSWLVIGLQGEKHYFTSETGALIFGSKVTTRKIYDEVSKAFSSSNIGQ